MVNEWGTHECLVRTVCFNGVSDYVRVPQLHKNGANKQQARALQKRVGEGKGSEPLLTTCFPALTMHVHAPRFRRASTVPPTLIYVGAVQVSSPEKLREYSLVGTPSQFLALQLRGSLRRAGGSRFRSFQSRKVLLASVKGRPSGRSPNHFSQHRRSPSKGTPRTTALT